MVIFPYVSIRNLVIHISMQNDITKYSVAFNNATFNASQDQFSNISHECLVISHHLTGFTKVLQYPYLVKEYKLYQKSISRKLHILVLSYVYTVSFTERRKQRAHI